MKTVNKMTDELKTSVEYWENENDFVVIPRAIIGASISAIDKKREAPKTLALLRHYAFSGIKSVADKEINELKIKLETVLLDENKLSDSYVRIREIVGAMSPPSLEPEALYAYVEKCVTEHSASSVEKFGEELLSDLRGDCWDEHDIQYIRMSLDHYIKQLRGEGV